MSNEIVLRKQKACKEYTRRITAIIVEQQDYNKGIKIKINRRQEKVDDIRELPEKKPAWKSEIKELKAQIKQLNEDKRRAILKEIEKEYKVKIEHIIRL